MNRVCFLCISVFKVASGPRVKLAGHKGALTSPPPPIFYSADRSKASFLVLVLLFVAFWFYSTRRFESYSLLLFGFILRGDLFQVLPCVTLFLYFSVLLVLRLSRLGKRELI